MDVTWGKLLELTWLQNANFVKKAERAKGKLTWWKHAVENCKKTPRGRLAIIISSNSCNENLMIQILFTGKIIKNTFEAWKVYRKLFWQHSGAWKWPIFPFIPIFFKYAQQQWPLYSFLEFMIFWNFIIRYTLLLISFLGNENFRRKCEKGWKSLCLFCLRLSKWPKGDLVHRLLFPGL